eukprot:Hpha_TRINITY_DN30512_c0_g1::TRINITY_DN30512_c0_g1_i1::g.193657::m.193657
MAHQSLAPRLVLSSDESPQRLNDPRLPGIPRVMSAYRHPEPVTSDGGDEDSPVVSGLPVEVSRVLTEAQQGATLVALFGAAEEGPCLRELEHLCKLHPEIRRFVDACEGAVQDVVEGWAVRRWLDSPSDRPGDDYFAQPQVDWPLWTLTLTAKWYSLVVSAVSGGYEWTELVENFNSLCGFGKGLLAAVAAACGGDEEELLEATKASMRAAFWVGFVVSKRIPPEGSMTWRGFSLPMIEQCVIAANKLPVEQDVRTYSDLEIGRVLSLRAGTVVGHPSDLRRFQSVLRSCAIASGVKGSLATDSATPPLPSRYYCNSLVRDLVNKWRDDGIEFDAQHLRVEALSPVTGLSLGQAGKPASAELAEAILTRCTSLLHIATLLPEDTRLIDLSPTNPMPRTLSTWLLPQKPMSAVSFPSGHCLTGEKNSPRRGTAVWVRRRALSRVAVINEVLYQHSVLPRGDCMGVDFSTRWQDL